LSKEQHSVYGHFRFFRWGGGQNRRSDIDIDIDIEFERNSEKSLLDLVRIENELKKVFKVRVDLGILSSLSPYIIEEVKR